MSLNLCNYSYEGFYQWFAQNTLWVLLEDNILWISFKMFYLIFFIFECHIKYVKLIPESIWCKMKFTLPYYFLKYYFLFEIKLESPVSPKDKLVNKEDTFAFFYRGANQNFKDGFTLIHIYRSIPIYTYQQRLNIFKMYKYLLHLIYF